MNLKTVLKSTKQFEKTLIKRSPAILAGLGISGFVFAGVSAVKVTPKAIKVVEQKELDEGKLLSKKEMVQTTWKLYLGPVALAVISAGCVIASTRISSKRNAALMAAYTLSESALKEYQEKTLDILGPKKEKEIRNAIANDVVASNPISSREVIKTGVGDMLCCDPLSGRYFISDIEDIRRAINDLNRVMHFDDSVSLNDFYDALNLRHTELGEQLGWHIDKGYIDPVFSSQLTEDNRPCLVVGHRNPPVYNYEY